MFILKKLIVKEWVIFFLTSTTVLFILITVANLISGLMRGNVTPQEVIINYIIELPSLFTKVFPISSLIASLFSINKLKNRSELAAIFSSGYSRRQFVLTIFEVSLLVAIVSFANSAYLQPYVRSHKEVLLPKSAHKFGNLGSAGLRASTIGTGRMWFKSNQYYFSFALFDKSKNVLNDVDIYYFTEKYIMTKRVSASLAQYLGDGYWNFIDGHETTSLDNLDFPRRIGFSERKMKITERPEDFKELESDITTLNFRLLLNYVKKLKKTGINTSAYEVMLYDKISNALVCILFAIVASIAIFTPNRRSSSFGTTIFAIFSFTIIYWFVYSYTLELGRTSKISPILACFFVPGLFVIFLSYYFFHHRKLR